MVEKNNDIQKYILPRTEKYFINKNIKKINQSRSEGLMKILIVKNKFI